MLDGMPSHRAMGFLGQVAEHNTQPRLQTANHAAVSALPRAACMAHGRPVFNDTHRSCGGALHVAHSCQIAVAGPLA